MRTFVPFSNPATATLAAIRKSFAQIEFDPQGKILGANEDLCGALGYRLEELIGQHHRLLVDATYAQSNDYRTFWASLAEGRAASGEFRRLAKDGRDVWLQASYTPVLGRGGRVVRVVKLALDVTKAKLQTVEDQGKIRALSRAQAVIEFTPGGEILTANSNFLKAVGYGLEEIAGRHHSMFVEPGLADRPDYAAFWDKLRAGEYLADEFKRVGKGGREIWLQATYNPIIDPLGRVIKVVKFATDVSDRVRAVAAVGGALSQLAGGNLRGRIDGVFPPALDALRVDFNAAVDQLQETMRGVVTSAETIRTGSGEISQASDDLSRRTEQQAASLEETAAALDEITATVRKTAEGANYARDIVSTAKADAEKSGEVVGGAVKAMTAIEGSAKQISNIIGVIDEIAFQTNLLALNAGVEAARAGDAGRGFAVVASEVRALAQRSADAAKEIKSLIQASSNQVDKGVELVDLAGAALTRIVKQVADISTVVIEISASTKEQATALAEVNGAVNQMDQVTQQNAAMVEQSTAASTTLAREAGELARLIRRFDVEEGAAKVKPMSKPAQAMRHAPVAALKTVGGRGLSAMAAVADPAADKDWEEF